MFWPEIKPNQIEPTQVKPRISIAAAAVERVGATPPSHLTIVAAGR